jgi:hypothetical protein
MPNRLPLLLRPLALGTAIAPVLLGIGLGLGIFGSLDSASAQTRPAPRPAAPVAPAAPPPAATPPAAPIASDVPAAVTQLVSQIDVAASQGDVQAVMAFYANNFTNSDGLTYATFQEALTQFLQRYPGMVYKTTINSWKNDGNAIVIETTTSMTGTQQTNDRPVNLNATIASRQRIENQKIVKQEILSERSQVDIGQTPPTVQINLPTQVTIGRNFSFDAVVMEPLGDRILLGAALEEPIQASGYLNAAPIELELLSSGGLFKTGRAPLTPESRWISAVIIREDGITAVTQRMQIVGR